MTNGKMTMTGGTISGNRSGTGAGHGGGAVLIQAGTITMTGGTICENTASQGGALYVNNAASAATVSGNAVIENNNAADSGGAILCNNGSLTMTGGVVRGNKASNRGGAFYGENITVKAGEVSGNQAQYGGVIYHSGDGPVELAGGTISGNIATNNGSVAYSNGNGNNFPQFRVTGGTLQINVGTLNAENVTVTDNRVISNTIICSGTDLYMVDCTIENNAAASGTHLSEVSVSKYGSVAKVPNAVITGKTVIGRPGVLYYKDAATVTVKALETGAMICGATSASALPLTIGDDTVGTMSNWYLPAADVPDTHADYEPLRGTVSTLSAGSYCLMGDLYLNGTVSITGVVTICLNGYTITGNTAANDGGVSYGNFTDYLISGGQMTGNKTGKNTIVSSSGKFIMSGGAISGNWNTTRNEPATAAFLSTYGSEDPCQGEISGTAVIGDSGLYLNGDTVVCTIGKLDRREASVVSKQKLEDLQDGTVYEGEDPATSYFLYTGAASTTPHEGWTELTGEEPVSELPAGSYYLGRDVVLTNTVTLDGDLQICLNGFDLLGEKAPFFVVPEGTCLTVCDHSKLGDGALNGEGKSSLVQVTGGIFEVQGGGVKNTTGNAVEVTGGEMILSGGTMQENETAIYASGTEQAPVSVPLSGGCMLDVHCHDVDKINCLFGMPKAVSSVARGGMMVSDGAYDSVCTNYVYEDGVYVNIAADWTIINDQYNWRMTRVNFEKGYVFADRWSERSEFVKVAEDGTKTDYHHLWGPKFPFKNKTYVYEILYYVDCLKNGKPVDFNPPEQSRDNIRIIMAEMESADNGGKLVTL